MKRLTIIIINKKYIANEQNKTRVSDNNQCFINILLKKTLNIKNSSVKGMVIILLKPNLLSNIFSGKDQVMVGLVAINSTFSSSQSCKAVFPLAIANCKETS